LRQPLQALLLLCGALAACSGGFIGVEDAVSCVTILGEA